MTASRKELPSVISEFQLSNSFLGDIVEVCLVTENHQRTMEGLVRLGIGPFWVYTFSPESVTGQSYRGEEPSFIIVRSAV
jgi:methylmalonyl-CoA/ethylmalonyl-CoA epimerase